MRWSGLVRTFPHIRRFGANGAFEATRGSGAAATQRSTTLRLASRPSSPESRPLTAATEPEEKIEDAEEKGQENEGREEGAIIALGDDNLEQEGVGF